MTNNIIGLSVCVNYSPILEISLKHNTNKLDHIYIVTKTDDHDTIKLCKKYSNVTILYYDFKVSKSWFNIHQKRYDLGELNNPPDMREEFWEKKLQHVNKNSFNKGGGLRMAQIQAAQDFPNHYQLILDSDIVLSNAFLDISTDDLQEDILYVPLERRDYKSMKDFKLQQNYHLDSGFSQAGWGFFQLYTPSEKNQRVYYDDWPDAAKTDVWFRNDIIKGDYTKKVTLNIHIDHLGTEGKSLKLKQFNFKF